MTGDVVCYLADGRYLFLWDGKPIAYLTEDQRVYAYDGRQLGWLENGWLYDRGYQPALFSVDATGGPGRPVRKARPIRSTPQRKPAMAVRQVGLAKAKRAFEWSGAVGPAYFAQ
ncbi:4-fold beta flower protein [uncultured Hyphomicrobium sp.]|uniref:4-fold beta flower protein n=1 Tax=uncultured Hyphomicrobium sp. TaxID=194373 RepID=UPI0025D21E70|nr:hypothetical protein [uncultured Hyphomicrobium sp.]